MFNKVLLFTGSRTILDRQFVSECFWDAYNLYQPDLIIVGDASGVDFLIKELCDKEYIPCAVFRANWSEAGNAAGIIRNIDMASKCDYGAAIWDGKSRGTSHCMKELKLKNKTFKVYEKLKI